MLSTNFPGGVPEEIREAIEKLLKQVNNIGFAINEEDGGLDVIVYDNA